jgi:hypothetical protein
LAAIGKEVGDQINRIGPVPEDTQRASAKDEVVNFVEEGHRRIVGAPQGPAKPLTDDSLFGV